MTHHIAPPPTVPKHAEAISYLNALLIDLKLRAIGKDYDPITPERLNQWLVHRGELVSCMKLDTRLVHEYTNSKLYESYLSHRHIKALEYFDALIDHIARNRTIGLPFLETGSLFRRDIERCTETVEIK